MWEGRGEAGGRGAGAGGVRGREGACSGCSLVIMTSLVQAVRLL